MKILYLINGLGFSQNTGIGGSDKRAIETIRKLKNLDPQSSFDILTTISGYNIFTRDENLKTNYFIIKIPRWWPISINKYLTGRIFSYFYAFLYSSFNYKTYSGYDIYFASSDFFFDVIPCWLFAKKYNKRVIYMVHHHIKSPWLRTGSLLNNIFLYLSQRISFQIIKNTTCSLFVYDTPEGRNIADSLFGKDISKKSVYYIKNGVNKEMIDNVKQGEKLYDACFVGGIRQSKGADEFVPIWKEVLKFIPDSKFLVIGGGSKEIVDKLKTEIESNHLENNIILAGPISGENLFKKIKSSKIFLFPSHEEGWGIAICEAMYCGLPVVCYDLPAFEVYGDILDKFTLDDYKKLANKTIDYLSYKNKIDLKKNQLIDKAQQFTWGKIAEDEYKTFKQILLK